MSQDSITMKEAVKLSAKSEGTLRRLIALKEIAAQKDKDGRYIISQDSLRHYLATKATPTPQTSRVARQGAVSRLNDESTDERVMGFR